MNVPAPILYAPTRADRVAAFKTLAVVSLYVGDSGPHYGIGLTDDWEAKWGHSVHYLVYHAPWAGIKMAEREDAMRLVRSRRGILVNSPSHFAAYVARHDLLTWPLYP